MAVADLSVRSKMATAAKRIARLKRVDRAAVFVITLGGLSVVLAVLGILVFIGAEALPMFRGAGVTTRPPVTLANAPSDLPPGIRAAGLDEYGRNLFSIEPDGTLVFRTLTDGAVMQVDRIAGLEAGPPVVSSSRSVLVHNRPSMPAASVGISTSCNPRCSRADANAVKRFAAGSKV